MTSPTPLQQMLADTPSLAEVGRSIDLTLRQRLKLEATLAAVRAYRLAHPLIGARKTARRDADLARLTGLKLRATGRPEGAEGEHYLSDDEIAEFERTGLCGPFRVISPDEASALADRIETAHASGELAEHTMMSREVVDTLTRFGAFDLDVASRNQALRMPEFFDLLQHPAIGRRVASLLGDDVLCWRSVFFRKLPGERGTFWHQNSVFREFCDAPKLKPPDDIDLGMAQLTVWVALRDATISNGTLRMALGTFNDARIEYMYTYAMDHPISVLVDVPPAQLRDIVTVLLFGVSPFVRLQALFEATLAITGDIFGHADVRSIEVKAGEAIIFTSLNMHASHDNTSADDRRLTFVGRYTSGRVAVFEGLTHDAVSTPNGRMTFPIDRLGSVQVHGRHTGRNRIARRPGGPAEPPVDQRA